MIIKSASQFHNPLRHCKNFADGSFAALVWGDRELYTSLGPRGAAWLAVLAPQGPAII